MSQEITEMVSRFEHQSQNNIRTSIRHIRLLKEELTYLDDVYLRYTKGRIGSSLTVLEKKERMTNIRERIVQINKNMAYYRECIAVDEKELDRLYREYGHYIIYDEQEQEQGQDDNYDY
jgi:hypothetical protein